jgi:Mrp family chromosome partitioning ATPase
MAEWMRRQGDDPTLARERLGAPVLSIFPKVRRLATPKHRLPDILTDWSSDFAERAQELRTNVEVALVGRTATVIAVIGPERGEGATTVAATLAMTLSRVGYRVIAVDADLRTPKLDEQLGITGMPGLGELADGARVPAQPGPLPGLEVVPAGTSDRHPAEVLRLALATVLESASTGTIVIVDCPPLRDAAENAFILSVCGSAIVVVNARRLRSKRVEWVGEQMSRSDCELLGVVINRRAGGQGHRHGIGRSALARGRRAATSRSGSPQVPRLPADQAFHPGSGPDDPEVVEPVASQDGADLATARPGQLRVSTKAARTVKSASGESASVSSKGLADDT